jgi:hypothetical protein
MPAHALRSTKATLLLLLVSACAPAGEGAPSAGNGNGATGGKPGGHGTGGASAASGGNAGSTGGASGSGSGGATPAPENTGGAGTGGSSGSGGVVGGDAGADEVAPAADGPPAPPVTDGGAPGPGPVAAGQGPVAEGAIKFAQDFEQNMNGLSRSPASLPVDRIAIIDDPVHQRGKVVRITFKEGDDFRTSPGTQPRAWYSSAMGYTVKPNTKVSVAWGFMWENVNMNAHFAQLIRDGGPTWMWDVDGGGTLSMTSHQGTGATGPIMKLEPMKWYDFMVTTDYRAGGDVRFYVNGKMVGTGKSPGGPNGRFDWGIYTRPGAHPGRSVFLSNVSIGEP